MARPHGTEERMYNMHVLLYCTQIDTLMMISILNRDNIHMYNNHRPLTSDIIGMRGSTCHGTMTTSHVSSLNLTLLPSQYITSLHPNICM